jgi:hypothetical protein
MHPHHKESGQPHKAGNGMTLPALGAILAAILAHTHLKDELHG